MKAFLSGIVITICLFQLEFTATAPKKGGAEKPGLEKTDDGSFVEVLDEYEAPDDSSNSTKVNPTQKPGSSAPAAPNQTESKDKATKAEDDTTTSKPAKKKSGSDDEQDILEIPDLKKKKRKPKKKKKKACQSGRSAKGRGLIDLSIGGMQDNVEKKTKVQKTTKTVIIHEDCDEDY